MCDTLTSDQKTFLEECALEFSDRFTDADPDYKKVFDEGIPPPPICPGYGRSNRPSGNWGRNRHSDQRDNRYRDRDSDYRRGEKYDRDRGDGDRRRDSRETRRFRPY